MPDAPRLLLATTTWWPSLAVLASDFEQAGFDVAMLCPKGHIAWQARRFACRDLDRSDPMASLLRALDAFAPALLVPGDERVVQLLRDLHVAHPRWRATIEGALGRPGSHDLLTARVALMKAAPRAGFAVPETCAISSDADLERGLAHVKPPWVLKVDGAWGGEGVRIATDSDEARLAYRTLRRGIPTTLALRRKFVNGDPFLWRDRQARPEPAVSLQGFVAGRPGNCAVFARDGHLLGATVVEAVATCGDHGPSTLVRTVDRPDVVAGARRLVAQRGLSGFLGFDLIVERTGKAVLIEMNPRVTMPCRVAAAAAAFGALSRRERPTPSRSLFADFPLAWLADPFDPALKSCAGDLPRHEPQMLRAGLVPLWPERGLLASLPSRLRSLRDHLRGRPRPDYRRRSFAWWLEQGGLGEAVASHHEGGTETVPAPNHGQGAAEADAAEASRAEPHPA